VDAVKLVIELVKAPVPEPPEAQESAVVGALLVAQHTPRAVTEKSPALVTAPPLVAVVAVIALAAVVLTVGTAPLA
jgi:hypothetical protein